MNEDLARHLALAACCLVSACGGASGALPPAQAREPSPEPREPTHAAESLAPVRAGRYRLRLSMKCGSTPTTATGVLTLQPMSGDEAVGDASLPGPSEAALLWGQTDLDLPHFLSCLGRSASPAGEPIHPSVLVEVLRWDGEGRHQVLLVSTDSAKSASAAAGVGVAMWVERAEQGHLAGVWSRWELIGRGEGRWQADLLPVP
jgi:hypothetical protein